MTTKQAETQRKYETRQKERGMMRATAWIPRDKANEFRAVVEALLKQWENEA